jgi:hypothetical protein
MWVLGVLENGVLRKIFGPKRNEVTGLWRKLHNKELYDLYSPPNLSLQADIRSADHVIMETGSSLPCSQKPCPESLGSSPQSSVTIQLCSSLRRRSSPARSRTAVVWRSQSHLPWLRWPGQPIRTITISMILAQFDLPIISAQFQITQQLPVTLNSYLY